MRHIVYLGIKGRRVQESTDTIVIHMGDVTINQQYRSTLVNDTDCIPIYQGCTRARRPQLHKTTATHVHETCHTHGWGMLYIYACTIKGERVRGCKRAQRL